MFKQHHSLRLPQMIELSRDCRSIPLDQVRILCSQYYPSSLAGKTESNYVIQSLPYHLAFHQQTRAQIQTSPVSWQQKTMDVYDGGRTRTENPIPERKLLRAQGRR